MQLHTESVGLHFRPSETKRFVNEELAIGDPLTLEREPSNPYDSNAIKVLADVGSDESGPIFEHIGFVPKTDNYVLAQLMDGGLEPTARVHSFVGKNPQIVIEWDD